MRSTVKAVIFGTLLWAGTPFLAAATKHAKVPEPDRIVVIGHLPLSGGPIVQLTVGDHWRRNYLYVDHGAARPITILDVTDATTPKATGELDIPIQESNGNLDAVVGTAALVASAPPLPLKQTVTIMSFADPEHPTVERQFEGVTAMVKDLPRGLVYLADAGGLWVLELKSAPDTELDEQYRKYLLYNH
jgi:hypothetical protein